MPDSHSTARRIVVAANPNAGRGKSRKLVVALVERLETAGYEAEVCDQIDDATNRAQRALDAGELRALIAAGGDGTIAELVNRTPPQMPLGLLPLGTENLLARYVGLDGSIETTFQSIHEPKPWAFDAGQANERVFLLMASCGFDAEVVRRFHARRRGPIRRWQYAQPIWKMVRSYQYPALRLYCDRGNGHVESLARWLFLFNLPCYALRLNFVPQANGEDGRLDYCAFEKGSFWHGLRYLTHLTRNQHQHLPDCEIGSCQTMRIECDQPVAYQLDGDPGGSLPLEISVLPRRFRLLVPATFPNARTSRPAPHDADHEGPSSDR